MGKTLMRELLRSLVSAKRDPNGYAYDHDGWLHCRGCHSAAMWPGEIPQHAEGCRVAAKEAA